MLRILFVIICITIGNAQTPEIPVYKNSQMPIEERIKDLLSLMTLEEKVDLVGGAGFKTKKNIRLGIP